VLKKYPHRLMRCSFDLSRHSHFHLLTIMLFLEGKVLVRLHWETETVRGLGGATLDVILHPFNRYSA
jgi:hypothetical protein